MKSFPAAWRFLTAIPFPPASRNQNEAAALERSAVYFPLVGLVLGFAAAVFDWGVRNFFPPLAAGALTVIFLFSLSGGMHWDGLADTADGFLSARPRERILEIMRDPRCGAMAVLAVVSVFALKWAALVDLPGAHRFAVMVLVPFLGRCNALVLMNVLPYARGSGGLASVFSKRGSAVSLALFGIPAAAASCYFMKTAGLVIVLGALAAGFAFARCSFRKIGGFTGDTLGAVCELTELSVLFLALMVSRIPL